MFRRSKLLVAALAAAAVTLAGCADNGGNEPADTGAQSAGFPVTVGAVTVDQRPERIVSLAPVATEMLFEIGAGPQVVAVDDMSNFPADAPRTDLSGYQPNVEAIAAKSPDLVVTTGDPNDLIAQLTKLKIPVYLAPAAVTLDDTYRQLTELGQLTGRVDEAGDTVSRMQDEITKLTRDLPKRTAPLTYYYELDTTYYSVTSTTFVGTVFAMAGLESIADASDADGAAGGYPQLSQETIIKADPDFIFLADTKCCGQTAATVAQRPGWSTMSAVRDGRVVGLDDDIASRWGPRTVDLLRVVIDAVTKVPA
ncbi:ABC transporter substrate-binding protein [Melissospora conviva]|uniref:ABC transporter substrate-binding protein n=1 Tax=Melissospora conviva TaxID=3388432 RepID=UPI003C2079A6